MLLNHFRDDGREFLAEHGKSAPIKRAASPDELAEMVRFLAAGGASFTVGSVVMAAGDGCFIADGAVPDMSRHMTRRRYPMD